MSKKSRKRNKRILAVLGVGAAAAMAAKKKRDAVISDGDANDNANKTTTSFKKASIADVSNTAKKDTAKKDTATKKTDVKTTRKRSQAEDSDYKGPGIKRYDDGSIIAKDKGSGNMVNYANKEKYSTRKDTQPPGANGGTKKPFTLIDPSKSTFAQNQAKKGLKSGGRAGYKSGGSIKKSMGKALRGGGKVMR